MSLRRLLFIIGLVLTTGVPFIFPASTFAAEDTCNCYCTSPTGATSEPDATTKIARADCQERCEGKGQTVAAFACTANQHPSRSLNCFTDAQCSDIGGVLGKNYQPPECPNGYYYCYGDPTKAAKTTLSTSIAGLTVTGDLGEYVSKAYLWMLGASTTIAIVFLMVAGLRWALGGLSAEQVGSAKKTISNAIVGLVLLMSTYLILATVNPQLLKLQLPSFPLIKTVSLVDNASCDDLIKEGYTVDYSGPKECGTVGTVTKDAEGNNVADGIACNFSYCANAREVCIPGEEPECMGCEELTANNTVLTPSASLCSAYNSLPAYETERTKITSTYTPNAGPNEGKVMEYTQDLYSKYEQCFFTHDPDAGGEITGRGACARVVINCGSISSCESYNSVPVFVGSSTNSVDLMNIDLGQNSGLPQSAVEQAYSVTFGDFGDFTLGTVCGYGPINDMCAYKRLGEDKGKACEINNFSIVPGTAITSAMYHCTSFNSDSWWAGLFD